MVVLLECYLCSQFISVLMEELSSTEIFYCNAFIIKLCGMVHSSNNHGTLQGQGHS